MVHPVRNRDVFMAAALVIAVVLLALLTLGVITFESADLIFPGEPE